MLSNLRRRADRAARRLAQAQRELGLRGVLAEALRLCRTAAAVLLNLAAGIYLDRKMGVRTRGILDNAADLVPLSAGRDPVHYDPTEPLTWWRVHSTIPIKRSAATFVDLGAGRGRTMILAAKMGFRRIVGVELDATLAAEAEENLRRWRSRRPSALGHESDIVVVRGDAATYRPPDGPLVIWLYNPFGPVTLRHVLTRLHDHSGSSTDQVYIAYLNPVYESVFGEFPELHVHHRSRRWVVYQMDSGSARE